MLQGASQEEVFALSILKPRSFQYFYSESFPQEPWKKFTTWNRCNCDPSTGWKNPALIRLCYVFIYILVLANEGCVTFSLWLIFSMFWFISRNFSCQSQCQNTAPWEPFFNVSARKPTSGDHLHSLSSHTLSDLETHLPFKCELSKTSPPIHLQHHLYRNIKKAAKRWYPFIARIKPQHG